MSENLKLWDAVQATDPKYTKGFSRSGGFKGTAINATYQIKRATEQWGPIGGKWGVSIVSSDFVPGADGDVVHVALVRFWHPDGEFQTFGQTTFVGKNKNGRYTDEEAPKKSLTDALTKALAMLGFSADVHLGLFDDNKYVSDMREHFKGEKHDPVGQGAWENMPPASKPVSPVRPNSAGEDFWNNAEGEEKEFLGKALSSVYDLINAGTHEAASAYFYGLGDELEMAAVWSQLSKAEQKIIRANKPVQQIKEAA